jgi:hypothetical protein
MLFLDTPLVGVSLVLLNRDDALPDDGSRLTVIGNAFPRTNHGYSEFSMTGILLHLFRWSTLKQHLLWRA